ncbi:DUF975 family protein [Treponema sp.]|uniref:DUF975 family protein n=1 Tax=Treponema sp. TaxID=166 RepID=UPI00298E8326|nr:DUF975 family protein [Treponema sp.]
MFSIRECKNLAKKQLKGNSAVLIAASLITFFVTLILDTTQQVFSVNGSPLALFVFVINFCITAVLTLAFYYACVKLAKTGSVSFSDFTSGLTHIKAGITNSIWHNLWIFIWSLLFIIPLSVVSGTLIMTVLASKFDLNALDPENLPIMEIKNELIRGLSNYIGITIFLVIGIIAFVIVITIKSIQYSQMTAIMAEAALENKKMSASKAMALSIELTKGHKMKIFTFFLSFIGWFILASIPLVIISETASESINPVLHALLNSAYIGIVVTFLVPYMATSFINVYGYLKQYAINTKHLNLSDFQ